MPVGQCFNCGRDDLEPHVNVCDDCSRDLQEEEFWEEQRRQWEREQMDEHFRKHPHG